LAASLAAARATAPFGATAMVDVVVVGAEVAVVAVVVVVAVDDGDDPLAQAVSTASNAIVKGRRSITATVSA
jgi:hypothetical protein